MIKQILKETYEAKMDAIDAKIAVLRTESKALHTKRKEVIDGGKMQGSSMTYRETLNSLVNDLRAVNANKRALQTQMKECAEQLDALDNEKRTMQKTMHAEYQHFDQVKDAIKRLEQKHKTTTFKSGTEENKVIKEIETLKASLPKAKRFSDIRPLVTDLINKKSVIWGELKEVKKQVEAKELEIEGIRKQMEVVKDDKSDIKYQADKITKEIEAHDEEITKHFNMKREQSDEYYKNKYDFEVQREEINHIQWMIMQKEKVV